jgi:hypothetical protein
MTPGVIQVDGTIGVLRHWIAPPLRPWGVVKDHDLLSEAELAPRVCETRLPAVVCACGYWLIDEYLPRPSSY